ncbi:MAG: copper chaperone PCu(A)C [Pseudomonadota bacterium]
MPSQRFYPRLFGAACACLLILLGAACSAPEEGGAGELPPSAEALGESGLWVSAPLLRPMPAMAMGAAYFTVHNRSGHDDRLLAVSVAHEAGAEPVEASLHETLLVDGISRMRSRAEGFALADGADLVLARGGAHVMLSGALAPDTPLAMTLRFERAGAFTITVPTAQPPQT